MPEVDLPERMAQYCESQGIFQRNQGNDFNFDQITVNVEKINWYGSANTDLAAGSGKKILFKRPQGYRNPLIPSQIQATKECEHVARVTTDTIIKGLSKKNGKIYLPLGHNDIPEEFDTHVKINLGKGIFKRTKKKEQPILSGEVQIGANGAEAFVTSQLKEFTGGFKCIISMRGTVIKRDRTHGIDQIDLATAIETLRAQKGYNDDKTLHALKVHQGKVFVVMHGDVQFRWPLQPYIVWQ